MKILHIVVSRHFAGSERVAVSLCKAQKRAGHDARLALRDGGNFVAVARKERIETLTPFLRKSWPNWGFLRAVKRFAPDVVHYHLTDAAKLAPRIQKVSPTAHVFHLHVNKRSRAYRKAAELGHLIAVSKSTQSFYEKELGIGPDRLHVVFNGVDANQSEAARLPKDAARLRLAEELGAGPDARFLYLPGRIDPVKGQMDLIEAMPTIRKAVPQARAVFSGSAANRGSYQEELTRRVAELGLQDCIHFLGWRGDVDLLTRAADVQVIPSRRDPFPLVVLESMALQTPVITTGVDGIGEMIPDNTFGVRYEVGDSAALATAAIELLSQPEAARALAERAYDRWQERYSIEAFAANVMAVYELAR